MGTDRGTHGTRASLPVVRPRQGFGLPSPRQKHGGVMVSAVRRALLWWPLVNLFLIYFLVSRRMLENVESMCEDFGPQLDGGVQEQPPDGSDCPGDCSGNGVCLDGACSCLEQFTGEDCSKPRCPRNCSGFGTCLPSGICLCKGRFVGHDCSIDISDLQLDTLEQRLGVPFSTGGALEDDIELVINTKSRQMYPKALCHSKQCSLSWMTVFTTLGPFLPRDDYKPHFKTCAVVSSSRQLVYGNATFDTSTDTEPQRRSERHGEEIDKHYMVMRLDNAPTAGYEPWVGKRTTIRLVQGDYAHMVENMLGTERVVNNTKSVVTPSTWWVGGYPQVEKVTYLMSVPATSMSNGKELRAPEHAGYSSFTEVFPGNRRFLLSPIFLRRAAEVQDKLRHTLLRMALDCIKGQQMQAKTSALFLAVLFGMQVCDHLDVYGVSVGRKDGGSLERVVRDSNFRMRVQGSSDRTECCYYPTEEDYTPEVPLCDAISRRYSFRVLQESGKVTFHE